MGKAFKKARDSEIKSEITQQDQQDTKIQKRESEHKVRKRGKYYQGYHT
jgi:hypothetical protein